MKETMVTKKQVELLLERQAFMKREEILCTCAINLHYHQEIDHMKKASRLALGSIVAAMLATVIFFFAPPDYRNLTVVPIFIVIATISSSMGYAICAVMGYRVRGPLEARRCNVLLIKIAINTICNHLAGQKTPADPVKVMGYMYVIDELIPAYKTELRNNLSWQLIPRECEEEAHRQMLQWKDEHDAMRKQIMDKLFPQGQTGHGRNGEKDTAPAAFNTTE